MFQHEVHHGLHDSVGEPENCREVYVCEGYSPRYVLTPPMTTIIAPRPLKAIAGLSTLNSFTDGLKLHHQPPFSSSTVQTRCLAPLPSESSSSSLLQPSLLISNPLRARGQMDFRALSGATHRPKTHLSSIAKPSQQSTPSWMTTKSRLSLLHQNVEPQASACGVLTTPDGILKRTAQSVVQTGLITGSKSSSYPGSFPELGKE